MRGEVVSKLTVFEGLGLGVYRAAMAVVVVQYSRIPIAYCLRDI